MGKFFLAFPLFSFLTQKYFLLFVSSLTRTEFSACIIHKISSISESKSRSTILAFRSLPLSLAHEEPSYFFMNDNCASVLVFDEKQVEKNSIILTFSHTTMDKHFSHHSGARAMRESIMNIPTRTFTHKQSREKYCTLRKLLILVRNLFSQRGKSSLMLTTRMKISFLKLPLCRISFYGYLLVVLHFMKVLLFVYPFFSFQRFI